jgi:hypothetical protein
MAKKKIKQVQKPIVKNIELEIIEKVRNYYKKSK